jgi:hypothetical protein
MTASDNTRDVAKTIETVQKLVTLAVSEAASDDGTEAGRTAAMQAAKLIAEHELVCVPKADLDRARAQVEGARNLARQTQAEGQKNMLLGAALGFMVGGGKLFR